MRILSPVFVVVSALAGCGSGCDSEHRRVASAPQPPHVTAHAAGPTVEPIQTAGAVVPVDGAVAVAPGFLDAPLGSLDGLFTGLAAAERGDPGARVLWLFFGDSHTAGDSLTSRLRVTLQRKFGD